MILTSQGTVPVAVFSAPFTASGWSEKAEATAFYQAYTAFLDDYCPDVLLTYGGHPVAVSMIELAKKRDIPVVFALHNFSYSRAEPFKAVDYVIVPSDFCRRYYWDKLGLACQKLPNVIDWRRVERAGTERPILDVCQYGIGQVDFCRVRETHQNPECVVRFTHPTGWVGVCDMKTIIVTGGAGFIGSCFIRQCIFVGDDGVALVLGDNIFYGDGFQAGLDRAVSRV